MRNKGYFQFIFSTIKHMMKIAMVWITLLVITNGCDDEKNAPLVLPSDLQLSIQSEEGKGDVTVVATAVNANFFRIYFGESDSETPVRSSDGTATHKYKASGTYTILVQAHATDADYITKTGEVVIDLEGGEDPISDEGYSTPLEYEGMMLVWNDEFDGDALNTDDWTFETGGHGWGNNELQFYRQENTTVKDGYLIITAKQESHMEKDYTSSRIITKDKQSFQYGRVDIRAALPQGQGIWPALWMLGANFPATQWPACGEIDIMEMIGGSGRENTVHGTVHWDNAGDHASYGKGYTLSSGTFADKFHVFSIVWNESSITWYVDDVQYNVIDISVPELSEFQNEFFFIMNVAVGGNWPGNPNSSTVFPQQMKVDYIRVFQEP